MNVLGFTLMRTKAAQMLYSLRSSTWFNIVREPFTGAWQKNVACETTQNLLAFSAVYACVSLIAEDIAKLRMKLMEYDERKGVWLEVKGNASPFLGVLRKPNRYQTRIQFLVQWIVSKLLHGNAYIYLQRDLRGVVVAQYVLDPRLVTPKVASDGSVWYELRADNLSNVGQPITVPASDIIHDRMITLWHPLIGVTPIYACGASATQGIRIQANSAKFFENMSRPSIHLSAPGVISDETLKQIKGQTEEAISGANLGRALVTGDGMKMEIMTLPPQDAQLIEQLRWTVEDVARVFKVPQHKLGLAQPTLNNIGALNQDYYSQCLQSHIESIEVLEDEALGLHSLGYGVELDIDSLLRMDPVSRADRADKLIRAAIWSPNEGRLVENLAPVTGGESPMIQQQNYSLAALAKRDSKEDPFATTPKPAPAAPPPEEKPEDATEEEDAAAEAQAEKLLAAIRDIPELVRKSLETSAPADPSDDEIGEFAKALIDRLRAEPEIVASA